MAITGVTNALGSSPQPTAYRPPTCSLMTATGSNQARAMEHLSLLCPWKTSANQIEFDPLYLKRFGLVQVTTIYFVYESEAISSLGHESSQNMFVVEYKRFIIYAKMILPAKDKRQRRLHLSRWTLRLVVIYESLPPSFVLTNYTRAYAQRFMIIRSSKRCSPH